MTAPTNADLWAARDALMSCADWLRNANRTGIGKDAAMSAYNRARAQFDRVAEAIREGREIRYPDRHTPDFETTVQGIPCGVVVTHWGVDRPAVIRQDPNDSCDAEYESPEWFLVDRRGYSAEWLEIKVTREDRARIDAVVLGGGDV